MDITRDMSKQEYDTLIKQRQKPSPIVKDCIFAFLIGGAICVVGQLIREGWLALGLSDQDAATATSASLILLSVLLTGLNVYNKIARYGGAGTLVPITGFANAVASPAIDFRSEGFVTGMAARMFTVAGPVIVYGVIASAVYGVILCLL